MYASLSHLNHQRRNLRSPPRYLSSLHSTFSFSCSIQNFKPLPTSFFYEKSILPKNRDFSFSQDHNQKKAKFIQNITYLPAPILLKSKNSCAKYPRPSPLLTPQLLIPSPPPGPIDPLMPLLIFWLKPRSNFPDLSLSTINYLAATLLFLLQVDPTTWPAASPSHPRFTRFPTWAAS